MRLSFDRLWIWIAIALPAFVALLVPLPAVDLAYQVRAGDEILATRALPVADTWTFTVWGTPWVDQQWLAQVMLAAGYAVGGWELLAVLRAGLVAFTTGVLVAMARERGASSRTAAILALAAFALAAPALALRPQLFGIALFAVLLWLIAVRGRSPQAVPAGARGRRAVGEPPRQLRAGARAPRVRLARATSLRSDPHVSRCGSWSRARSRRSSTRTSRSAGPTRWGSAPTRRSQARSASGSGRRRSRCPGCCSTRRSSSPSALMLRRRDLVTMAGLDRWSPRWRLMGAWAVRGVAWWALVMVFLLAGVLADRAPGTRPACQRRERGHRRRAGRRHRGRAAVVASGGPADRAGGPAVLRAERAGGQALPSSRAPEPGSSCRRRGAPGSSGRPRSRRTSSTPGSSSSRRTSGRTTRRWQGSGAGEVLDRWAVDVVVVPAGESAPPGPWQRGLDGRRTGRSSSAPGDRTARRRWYLRGGRHGQPVLLRCTA